MFDPASMTTEQGTRVRRKSAFKELGLDDFNDTPARRPSPERPALKVRFRSKNDIFEPKDIHGEDEWEDTSAETSEDEGTIRLAIPKARARPTTDKFALVAFVLIISTLIAQLVPMGKSRMLSVEAVPPNMAERDSPRLLSKRQDSSDPTDYCKKWGHQSALVNGTLYLYGGRKSMTASQTSNTWSELNCSRDCESSD
jgi:hypothetical protein